VTNAPIIREQLQKAGVRLAHLLDAALGKQLLHHGARYSAAAPVL